MAVGVPVASAEGGPRPVAGVGGVGRLHASRPARSGVVQAARVHRQGGPDPHLRRPGRLRGRAVADSSAGPEIVLVGVGTPALLAGDRGLESLRRAAAAFVRAVGQGDVGRPPPARRHRSRRRARSAAAVAEGAVLASYRYDAFRTGEIPGTLATLAIVPGDADDEPGGARAGRPGEPGWPRRSAWPATWSTSRPAPSRPRSSPVSSSSGSPGWTGSPSRCGTRSASPPSASGACSGWPGVRPSRPGLVRVEYRPADPIEIDGRVPHLALVGKGITFDSGGLSLKTATGMETMKTDMGGAAAVLSAVDAAAALGARIRITAITPLTENMPGGSATKPGDVLTTRNGKTIEVLNTDAEGRLVLADGLTLATEAEPDAIVDLATLTGAAVVALGKEIAGLLGNDDDLIAQVRAAGDRAGEPLWPLPLPDDYRSHIESEIADMRNVGRPGQAGSIAAAMLLREFVGEVPWAHLDIAGPARSDENSRYLSKGGTGFGVRTLVELMTSEQFAGHLVSRSREDRRPRSRVVGDHGGLAGRPAP